MDWRELWRLRLSRGATPAAPRATLVLPDIVDGGDAGFDEDGAGRPRFLYVVARTRLDLYLSIRRQYRDDRTVHVLLDRREQERRARPSAGVEPERRHADRRRVKDYWEDTAHHPAVLIPLGSNRSATSDTIAPPPPVEVVDRASPAPARALPEEARLHAWLQESRDLLYHVLPGMLAEHDAFERHLHDATRRHQALEEEIAGLRAEAERATRAYRELEARHADVVSGVGELLTRLTEVLGPVWSLADKLREPRR
jgi:hypothetical protein